MTTPPIARRVLLVEDEAASAALVIDALRPEGFAIEWRDSGESGLRTAALERFDLLILDRMLPAIDGLSMEIGRAHV